MLESLSRRRPAPADAERMEVGARAADAPLSLGRASQMLAALVLVATALRLVFAWALGLGVDESYMVASGRHLAFGYFDHPPAAWWLQWGAAHLLGTDAPLAVRLPFIALFAFATWLMFRLGRAVGGERAGLIAAAAFNLSPVFGVTTGTWVLPDGPLDCALLGAALCLVRALGERGILWWGGAGLCAGLALFSKYTAALSILGAFAYLILLDRRWLARPGPYVAALLALLVFAPVIVWNARHGWASFAFQADRAAGLHFRPAQPFVVLAGEALFVLPWIWAGMAAAAWQALAPRPERASFDARALLLCLAVPPIILFAFVALWSPGRVLFHWAAPGYLMLFPLLGAWLAERPLLARRTLVPTAALVVAGLLFVSAQVRLDFLRPVFTALHARDPELEATDWTSLKSELARRGLLPAGAIVGVPDWRDAGKIAYALGPNVTLTVLNPDAREFGVIAPAASLIGHNLLVLVRDHPEREAARLAPDFTKFKELPPAIITHAGEAIGSVAVFSGTGLRRAP